MANNDNDPVILGAVRTPFGKFGGGLLPLARGGPGRHRHPRGDRARPTSPRTMSRTTSWAAWCRPGWARCPRGRPAFKAGLGREVTSDTINRVCASGMRAVTLADDLIRLGHHQVIVAGRHGEHEQRALLL